MRARAPRRDASTRDAKTRQLYSTNWNGNSISVSETRISHGGGGGNKIKPTMVRVPTTFLYFVTRAHVAYLSISATCEYFTANRIGYHCAYTIRLLTQTANSYFFWDYLVFHVSHAFPGSKESVVPGLCPSTAGLWQIEIQMSWYKTSM